MNAEPRMIPVPPHTFGGDASGDPSKRPSLYDAVRHERVMRLAEQGVTGRRARRLIAQAEARDRRKDAKTRLRAHQKTAGPSGAGDSTS